MTNADFDRALRKAETEVERLQKELGECQAGFETGTKALAENERLRAALMTLGQQIGIFEVEAAELRAEVEQLRADNDWLRKTMSNAIAAQDFREARQALDAKSQEKRS